MEINKYHRTGENKTRIQSWNLERLVKDKQELKAKRVISTKA